MTDKEKLDAIRAEIHRLVDVRGYDREMANDLFAFMDSLSNEPVSGNIDFEQELYKAFGQVKDFTLGMQIAKWFYDMGKNSQEQQFFRLKESVKLWSGKDEDNFEDEFAKTLAEKKEILPRNDERFSDFDLYKIALHFSGWKKRQMMKDSVDGIVYSQRKDMAIVRSNIFFPTDLNKGDKVKLIIIKED